MEYSKNKLVSVCIPAYNSSDYITETISSVLEQSYDNIELIIVDDQSVDNTYELVKEYRDRYYQESKCGKKIRVYQNESNLGMSGNWNRCLELCEGDYIKLICADDLLSKDAIEKEVSALESYPGIVCVSSDTLFIDGDGKKKGSYPRYWKSGIINGHKAVMHSLFTRDCLGAPLANLFRKNILKKIGGFDERYDYILDYDFFIRVYLEGEVFIIHQPLNMFRIRRDSNTGSVMGGGKESIYINEHRMLLNKLRDRLHLSFWQIGISMFMRKFLNTLGSAYLSFSLFSRDK